ncbi:hypothetical protein [Streptomyces sp. NPDC051546]|uniref:hypothetical protein n=1 Tax=Streptomyces sp. NPDC051546 TaxID=3365655 RepID=UPI0037A3362E
MANRTRSRDFERRIQRSKAAACGAEQARTIVARLRPETGGARSNPASEANSPGGES